MAASIIDCKIIQAKLRKNFRSILSTLRHSLENTSNSNILILRADYQTLNNQESKKISKNLNLIHHKTTLEIPSDNLA